MISLSFLSFGKQVRNLIDRPFFRVLAVTVVVDVVVVVYPDGLTMGEWVKGRDISLPLAGNSRCRLLDFVGRVVPIFI